MELQAVVRAAVADLRAQLRYSRVHDAATARMAARARGSPLMVRGNDDADRKKRPGG
mgnify:CR=1 FL=1